MLSDKFCVVDILFFWNVTWGLRQAIFAVVIATKVHANYLLDRQISSAKIALSSQEKGMKTSLIDTSAPSGSEEKLLPSVWGDNPHGRGGVSTSRGGTIFIMASLRSVYGLFWFLNLTGNRNSSTWQWLSNDESIIAFSSHRKISQPQTGIMIKTQC